MHRRRRRFPPCLAPAPEAPQGEAPAPQEEAPAPEAPAGEAPAPEAPAPPPPPRLTPSPLAAAWSVQAAAGLPMCEIRGWERGPCQLRGTGVQQQEARPHCDREQSQGRVCLNSQLPPPGWPKLVCWPRGRRP